MGYPEHLLLLSGVMLLMFFAASYIFQRLKLPSLLAYIFLGVALAGLLSSSELEIIDQLSRLGIVLLFFMLGLHFPLNRLFNISRRIWKVGMMDIVFNFGGSFLIAYLFGFDLLAALVIGGVAYATSSSISVKLMEESSRLKSPEGEFKLALLIFEDLAAPVLVSFLVGLSAHGAISPGAVGLIFLGVDFYPKFIIEEFLHRSVREIQHVPEPMWVVSYQLNHCQNGHEFEITRHRDS